MAVKKQTKKVEQLPSNVVALSNGDKVFFTKEMLGKHHLAMQKTVSKAMKSKPTITEKGEIKNKVEIDIAEYEEQLVNLFPALVEKIEDKEGKPLEIDVNYYLNSRFEDARLLYSKIMETVANARSTKKN